MFGRQLAALGLSGMLLFSGVVTAANAEEVTPIDFAGHKAVAEILSENGVASCSATALQTGDGLLLAEEAGLAALADTAFRRATLDAVRRGRATLRDGLTALGCTVWPSAANFLLFRLPPDAGSAKGCFEALLRRGIIIRPLNSYNLPEHLRVSVGDAGENAAFLAAMREILAAPEARRA